MTTQNTGQTTAPRSAASAAAEYGLGHDLESDLPVIPALAEINHIRVIDKSGASYRATPAQMREMVGIDRSILTEQAIPGEYFVGRDGTRKQVYGRLLKLTAAVGIYEGNGYVQWFSVLIADTIVESSGVAKMPDSNNRFRIISVTSGSKTGYGMFTIHRSPDDKLYTFGFDSINASHVGRPVELSIFVKYTK